MNVGDVVTFNGGEFRIKWIYESGYCEIQYLGQNTIELVHISKIQKVINKPSVTKSEGF